MNCFERLEECQTLVEALGLSGESAVKHPAAVGGNVLLRDLTHPGLAWTHERLSAEVLRCARLLHSMGINRGSVVAMVFPNGVEFVAAFLSVTSLGAVAAPLNPAYRAEELEFYLEDSRSQFVLTPVTEMPIHGVAQKLGISVLKLALDPKGEINVTTDESSEKKISDRNDQVVQATPTDVCLLLHTSGTTSRPKAVPLTHRNLARSLFNIARTYELSASDSTILVMPLFHVHGLICGLLTSLAVGCPVVISQNGKFSASQFWKDAVEWGVTWFTAVPTIHQVLLLRAESDFPKSNPPPLRFIRSCSSALAPSLIAKLESAFGAPVLEAYAMTEAAHQMCSNPLPKVGPHIPGTVGCGQGVEVAILDADLRPLEAGHVGEICIRGLNVTSGYLRRPEANEEAFRGGWFHTGDQGQWVVVDRDDGRRYVQITGRIKELINRGGEKISPLEVDGVLLAHPKVAEAVCFGTPDDKYGEEIHAALVLKEEFRAMDNAEATQDVLAFITPKLSSFKVPKKLYFCDSLPKTATGKTQRRMIAAHFTPTKAGGE